MNSHDTPSHEDLETSCQLYLHSLVPFAAPFMCGVSHLSVVRGSHFTEHFKTLIIKVDLEKGVKQCTFSPYDIKVLSEPSELTGAAGKSSFQCFILVPAVDLGEAQHTLSIVLLCVLSGVNIQ